MAGSAVIGSLRVDLGLNSAQFSSGLKNSQGLLKKFGVQLTLSLETIAEGIGRLVGAFPKAIKGAIDHADALSKSAQKAGVTTEALSRLAYAADYSDVSLDQLTGGLQKLSKAMVDAVGSKTSAAATAFKALGISVTDANGKLRDSDDVFTDVADRFAAMEDGATKTALSLRIFGKAGADLIPLLNSGGEELRRMGAEADRLGITLSTTAGKNAERFNDTLTLVGKVLQGVTNQVMEAALPALQEFAQFLASPDFAEAAKTFGTAMITVLKSVAEAIAGITLAARDLFKYLNANADNGFSGISDADLRRRIANSKRILSDPGNFNSDMSGTRKALAEEEAALARRATMDPVGNGTSFSELSQFGFGTNKPPALTIDLGDLTGGAKAAKSAVVDLMGGIDDAQPKVESFASTIGDQLADSFSSMADAVLSGVAPLKALGDELANIGKSLISSGIQGFFANLFKTTLGGGFLSATGYVPSFGSVGMFAEGGVTNRPAIFGEGGPEAAVPLPDGRSIPVTLSGDLGGGGLVQNFYIDAKGAEIGVEKKIVLAIKQMVPPMIKGQAPSAVMQSQRNRG